MNESARVRPGLIGSLFRQWRVEREVRLRGGSVRTSDPEQIRQAYNALSRDEFDAINGPQRWVNWTILPAVLSGLLPDRPLKVVDLGCGIGDSLEVLASCTRPGSRFTGVDVSEASLATARSRTYRHGDGNPAEVGFSRQSIVGTLRDGAGHPIAAMSLDLAAASGVVGHHLEREAALALAGELRRAIAPRGLAVLDAGPRLRLRSLRDIMDASGFELIRVVRYGPLNPRAQLAFRRLEDHRGVAPRSR